MNIALRDEAPVLEAFLRPSAFIDPGLARAAPSGMTTGEGERI
jgi:hypothetical protein